MIIEKGAMYTSVNSNLIVEVVNIIDETSFQYLAHVRLYNTNLTALFEDKVYKLDKKNLSGWYRIYV